METLEATQEREVDKAKADELKQTRKTCHEWVQYTWKLWIWKPFDMLIWSLIKKWFQTPALHHKWWKMEKTRNPKQNMNNVLAMNGSAELQLTSLSLSDDGLMISCKKFFEVLPKKDLYSILL